MGTDRQKRQGELGRLYRDIVSGIQEDDPSKFVMFDKGSEGSLQSLIDAGGYELEVNELVIVWDALYALRQAAGDILTLGEGGIYPQH